MIIMINIFSSIFNLNNSTAIRTGVSMVSQSACRSGYARTQRNCAEPSWADSKIVESELVALEF